MRRAIVWCQPCSGWVEETADPAAHVVLHSDPGIDPASLGGPRGVPSE